MSNGKLFAGVLVVAAIVLATNAFRDKKQAEPIEAAANIFQGLASAMEITTHASVFHAEQGKMPESNAALGIGSPASFATPALDSAEIGQGGIVTLKYNAASGVEGGTITLTPEVLGSDFNVKWHCATSSYPKIANTVPQCVYRH